MLINVMIFAVFSSEMNSFCFVEWLILEGVGYMIMLYTIGRLYQVKLVLHADSQHFTDATAVNTGHESFICRCYSVNH